MKISMQAKLEQLERRLAEVNLLLSSEQAARDLDAWRRLNREHSDLAQVVDHLQAWRQAERDLETAEAMRGDPDLRAVHNRLYWTHGEYLGLGVSAHSFRRLPDGTAERFANQRGPSSYLRTWHKPSPQPFALQPDDPSLSLYELRDRESLWKEALWLALRELDGVRYDQFVALHDRDPRVLCAETLSSLTSRGLIDADEAGLRLSSHGVLFADEVGAAFL